MPISCLFVKPSFAKSRLIVRMPFSWQVLHSIRVTIEVRFLCWTYHNLCNWKWNCTWIPQPFCISLFSILNSDLRRRHLFWRYYDFHESTMRKKWHKAAVTRWRMPSRSYFIDIEVRTHTKSIITIISTTYSASSICLPHPAQVGLPQDLHSSFQHIF